jgi:type IV pilus assembly protein PilB
VTAAIGQSAALAYDLGYVVRNQTVDITDAPVIEFVDELIQNAILQHVSDIHIEPYNNHCRIRYRRDGLLSETATISTHLSNQVCMRLKIMSHLNIAEKRLPQDGRMHILDKKKIDIRINTCPTLFGEKIALRILDTKSQPLSIETLGMTKEQLSLFQHYLAKPQGLIIVTGPTGSGKTITLYSALHYLNTIEKNISTIEDPIEIELMGINQISINPKIGFDFQSALRTLLRQDPDILMIGEIRDKETANMAVQAAETGHLVLTTLHTNNAATAISRLESLGVNTSHLLQSTPLIIAQRLIRSHCTMCRGAKCEHCLQGYAGRTGIFELLMPSNTNSHCNLSLLDSGLLKVANDISSMSEITRVLGT